MSNRVNRIVKRIYYAVELQLRSSLAISSGEDGITDMDILRNRNGEVFIPGTSIAGAFRNYLQKNKEEDCNFGFSRGEEGRMSSVCISDLYFAEKPVDAVADGEQAQSEFDKTPVDAVADGVQPADGGQVQDKFDKRPVVTVRDGVQLTDGKQVRNKFDMEIIETGASGILYFHYVIRENDRALDADSETAHLLCGMERGEIRFGGNKTRGFGKLAVGRIYQAEFDSDHVQEWISFSKKIREISAYPVKKGYEEWMEGRQADERKYYLIRIPLKLTGGISIRKYSAEPLKADFEHITCNGEPIIPGTSWNGAIRADVKEILQQLGCSPERSNSIIRQWFGYVELKKKQGMAPREKKKVNAWQSAVIIEESIIRNSVPVPMTRNKISRFDASAVTGALYSEITCCGGETELEIMVRKDESRWYYALLAVLELAVQDICKGYVAVGGQTAIGRGIFSGSSEGFLDKESRKRGQQELLYLIDGKEAERCAMQI